ncbi:MAG: NAD(P)H-dependent glycerol-3-phosphate dehydrogenase [Desulfocucumaceae bacterium]
MTVESISVLGAGSWGTALAIHLARKGHSPWLWSHRKNQVLEMKSTRRNSSYLLGSEIPENVSFSGDLEEVVRHSTIIISAVPSHAFRDVLTEVQRYIIPGAIVINAAKGIDENTLQRISQIYSEISGGDNKSYAVLSGPSHAEEVSVGMPTAVVVASFDNTTSLRAQDILMSGDFRVYTHTDVIGVELGGALKNIIALGTGISDGLGYGDNTKAALMTRGLAEITRLGMVAGSNPLTFAGLAGLGDLIVTCTSMHSRNRRAGIEIGKGKTPGEALTSVRMVVEGVRTTKAAYRLSHKHQIEMPITQQIYKVLYEGGDPREAVVALMGRGKRNEMEHTLLDL